MRKIISLLVLICFLAEQSCFAQILPQVLPLYFTQPSFLIQDKFRPIHLRSIEFTPQSAGVQVLLDKGDSKELKQDVLQEEAGKLMDYFLIGLTLPNDAFWVNLRPDQADNIIDPYLEKTDIGKVMLAADLNLKKDLALATSPATREGKEYWDKLYVKAQELFGDQQVSLPTFTRPWIVPAEIIIRQSKSNASGLPGNAYIYKATLKVMLEQDYLIGSAPRFEDNRLKELNDYSSELIRRLIIPKLTLKVNSSKTYAPLRQVYYSLILAQWFKEQTKNGSGVSVLGSGDEKQSRVDSPQSIADKRLTIIDRYVSRTNKRDLTGLTSKEKWEKNSYFNQYKQSFQKGEYNESETINTPYGQTIRQYTSGGIGFGALPALMAPGAGNVLTGNKPFIPGFNLAVVSVDEEGSVVVGAQSMARSKGSSDGGAGGTADGVQDGGTGGKFQVPTANEQKILIQQVIDNLKGKLADSRYAERLLGKAKFDFNLTTGFGERAIEEFIQKANPGTVFLYLPTIDIEDGDLSAAEKPQIWGKPAVEKLKDKRPYSLDEVPLIKEIIFPEIDVLLVSKYRNGRTAITRLGFLPEGTPVLLKTTLEPVRNNGTKTVDNLIRTCLLTKVCEELGFMTPVYGLFQAPSTGDLSLVMGIINGDFPLAAGKFITKNTIERFIEFRQRLMDLDLDTYDLQPFIDRSGRLRFIDESIITYDDAIGSSFEDDILETIADIFLAMKSKAVIVDSLKYLHKADPELCALMIYHFKGMRDYAKKVTLKKAIAQAGVDSFAPNDGGMEKQNDPALDDGAIKSPVGDTIKDERQETDMEQSLELRYRDAVRGYFSQLNDLEAEVKEKKLVPGTPPWMKAALNKYAGLIKGIMPVLEDSGQEITFVYPFEGADSIPALLRRTYHLNYEISDLDLGEEVLKEVFGEEKRAEIINRDTPLDALEKSNYETVRNAIKGPCVFILKGFAGWAKKNKASTFNKDLLRFILADVLREGDKVLVLYKNDLDLYNSLSEKVRADFLKHEQYVFDGKPFFIGTKGVNDDSWEKSIRLPNAVMILEKKPVTSARDGGEELRQRRTWLDDYEKALVVSSGRGFKTGEVNSPEVIRSITVIGGTPIADINKKAQKHAYSMSGFADDVIEQMVLDHQTVASLGTTHKELAGLLWMVVEKCCNREERFSYNGMDYRLESWGSLGSQFSIFSNRFWWGALDDFTLINITQGTFQKFTSNSIAEIGALGFYEGRVVGGAINEYAVDPELLWRMFKDKDYRKPYVSVEEALAKRAERIKKQEGWDSVEIYTLPQLKNVLPFVIRPIAKPRYQEEFYSESEKEKTDYRPWEQTYVFEVRKKGPWTAIVRTGIRYSDAVVEDTGAKATFWGSGVDVFRGNIPIYATNNFRPEYLKKETGLDLVNILESFDRKEKTRITDDERWFYNELRFSASEQLGKLFISAISKDLDYPSLLEDIFSSNFIYESYDFAVSYGDGKQFIPLSRQIEIIKTLLCEAEEKKKNADVPMGRDRDGDRETSERANAQTRQLETSSEGDWQNIERYLKDNGNDERDIDKALGMLRTAKEKKQKVFLELACGSARLAYKAALSRPEVQFIATDEYDLNPDNLFIDYALSWKNKELKAQTARLPNLVVLRAEAKSLNGLLPENTFIDTILIVNPLPELTEKILENDGLIKRKVHRILLKPCFEPVEFTKFKFQPVDSTIEPLGFNIMEYTDWKGTDQLYYWRNDERIAQDASSEGGQSIAQDEVRVRRSPKSKLNSKIKDIYDKRLPGKKFSIKFVCEGNFNRSPAMLIVFNDIIDKLGIAEMIEADSFGFAMEGEINEKLFTHAERVLGRKIQVFESKIGKTDDMINADMIIVAEEKHKRWLVRDSHADIADKIFTLGEFFENLTKKEQGNLKDLLKKQGMSLNDFDGIRFDMLKQHIPDPQSKEISIPGMLVLIRAIISKGVVPLLLAAMEQGVAEAGASKGSAASTPQDGGAPDANDQGLSAGKDGFDLEAARDLAAFMRPRMELKIDEVSDVFETVGLVEDDIAATFDNLKFFIMRAFEDNFRLWLEDQNGLVSHIWRQSQGQEGFQYEDSGIWYYFATGGALPDKVKVAEFENGNLRWELNEQDALRLFDSVRSSAISVNEAIDMSADAVIGLAKEISKRGFKRAIMSGGSTILMYDLLMAAQDALSLPLLSIHNLSVSENVWSWNIFDPGTRDLFNEFGLDDMLPSVYVDTHWQSGSKRITLDSYFTMLTGNVDIKYAVLTSSKEASAIFDGDMIISTDLGIHSFIKHLATDVSRAVKAHPEFMDKRVDQENAGRFAALLNEREKVYIGRIINAVYSKARSGESVIEHRGMIDDGGSLDVESLRYFFDYLRLYGLKDTAWESKRSGQDEKQTSDFWQLIEEEMRATALFVENTLGDNHITYMRLKGVPLYMDLGLREISRSGFNPDVVVFLATEAVPLEVCYRLLRERRGLKAPEYVVLEVHMPKSEGSDYGSLNKPEEEKKIRENIIRETKGIEIKGKQVLVIDATAYNGFTMGLTRDAFLSLGVTGLKTFSLMSPKFIPNYVPDYVGVCVEDTPLMVWAKMLLNEGATNEVGKILAAVTFLYLNQTEGKEDRLLDKIAIAEPMGMKELRQGAKLFTLKDLKGNSDGGKSMAQDEGNRERAGNEQNNLIQQVLDKLKPQLADSRYAEKLLRKAKVDFELPLEGQWAIKRVIREAKAGTVFLYLPTIDIEDGDLPEKAAMISIWGKPAVEKLKGKRPYPLNEVPFINEVIFPDNDVFLVSKSRNGVNATAKLGFLPDGAPVLVKTTISPITIEEIKENDDLISKCLLTKVVEELGFTASLYGFFKDPSTGSISLVMDIINGDFPSAAGEFISAKVTKDCIEFRKELRDLNLYMSDDLQPIIDRSGRIKFIDDPIVTNDDAVAVAFQDEIFIRLIALILCAAQNQEVIEGSLKYFQEAYPELFHMLLASLEQKDEYAANVALQKAIKQVKLFPSGIVSSVPKLKADGGKGEIDSSAAKSSPSIFDKKLGGIDFRNLPINAQSVPAAQLNLPVSPQSLIPLAELDNKWKQIRGIVERGDIPSGERIKEYVLSCCQRGDISADVEKVLVCISEILRLEEDYALACEPGFVRFLSVLESDKPAQELQIALSAVSFGPE